MPCGGTGPTYEYYLKEQLDETTQLFCSLLNHLEKTGQMKLINSNEINEWWKNHKEVDAIRQDEIKRQHVRKVALQKLTDEEKAALFDTSED